MKLRPFWILSPLCLALSLLSGCGRVDNDIRAKVEDWTLTNQEFREIAIARWGGEQAASQASVAELEELLEGIVIERLMIVDGYRKGLDKNPEVQLKYENAIKRAVVFVLNDKEIPEPVISEEVLREFFKHDKLEVTASHIRVKITGKRSEEKARKTAESIRKEALRPGVDFTELANRYNEDPEVSIGISQFVPWSGTEPPFEVAAYNLQPGEISGLVRSDEGWNIIRVEEVGDRIGHTLYDEDHKSKMRRHLIGVRRSELVKIMEDSLRKARNFTYHEDNVYTVLKALEAKAPDQSPLAVLSEAQMKLPLVTLDNGEFTLTVLDIINRDSNRKTIDNILKSEEKIRRYCHRYITREIIVQDYARKLGYFEHPECLKHAQDIKDNKIYNLVRKMMIIDKAKPAKEVAEKYFEANQDKYMTDPEYRLLEILVSEKEKADELVKRINNGEKIADLAIQYSERSDIETHKGLIGPLNLDKLGDIGEIAAKAKTGELLGPFYLTGYEKWTIFKIVSKIDPKPLEYKGRVKKQALKDLKDKQRQEFESAWVAELKQNISYKINSARLHTLFADVETTENSSF